MTKLTLACVLIAICAVSIATLTVKAAGPDDSGVMSFRGRANWAWATTPDEAHMVNQDEPDRDRVIIFSNLGPKNQLFERNVALDVAGPDSGVQQQWLAMPFTPAFDAEITEIAVAVEHNTGAPNAFRLSFNADAGGLVPGKVLHTWKVTHAPKFGTCCVLDIVKSTRRLEVKKGTQYWVVARTNEEDEATRMEWNLSPLGIEGNFAVNNGQGWFEDTEFTCAFAVYGKKSE